MRGILKSVHPKRCEQIANGECTMLLSKTAPKLQTPFKCYIYETKQRYKKGTGIFAYGIELQGTAQGRGKVIGEFVCDSLDKYESEFWNDTPNYMDENHAMEQIRKSYFADPDDWECEEEFEYITGNEVENPDDCELCRNTCLTYGEIRRYVGTGDRTFYTLHISDLKIYDKPKELSEFRTPCKVPIKTTCSGCGYASTYMEYCTRPCITRPPQSWCYVEEL